MSEEQKYEVFKYKVPKLPKVIRRKLGKHKAYAQYDGDNLIEIDPLFKGKKELILYLHEFFHHLHPNWTEDEVIMFSESTAEFLWKHHYRKVDNEEK